MKKDNITFEFNKEEQQEIGQKMRKVYMAKKKVTYFSFFA